MLNRLQIFFILFATATAAFAAEPKNLRVVWTESPQTKALIAWDSSHDSEGRLYVKEGAKDAEPKQYSPSTKIYGGSEKGKGIYTCYSVALTDLKPDTTYFLTAQAGDEKTKEHYFITAPDKDKAFKLFFAGDSRTGYAARKKVSKLISQMLAEDPSYIALLHGGDYTKRANQRSYDGWLSAYYLTTTADGRLLPIIPVRGNHEGAIGSCFGVAYGFPGGIGNNFYTCMLSPQVGVVVLNTSLGDMRNKGTDIERRSGGRKRALKTEFEKRGAPLNEDYEKRIREITKEVEEEIRLLKETFASQEEFLKGALEEMEKSKTRFRMAAYHRPMYPAIKGKMPADKPYETNHPWVPLFEKFNIDLGLESDGHCIKRTVPIRAGKQADDGVVYLGEGGYGAPQRDYKGGRWFVENPGFVSKGDHVMVLSFSKDTIEYFTMDVDKGMVDQVTFPARKR